VRAEDAVDGGLTDIAGPRQIAERKKLGRRVVVPIVRTSDQILVPGPVENVIQIVLDAARDEHPLRGNQLLFIRRQIVYPLERTKAHHFAYKIRHPLRASLYEAEAQLREAIGYSIEKYIVERGQDWRFRTAEVVLKENVPQHPIPDPDMNADG